MNRKFVDVTNLLNLVMHSIIHDGTGATKQYHLITSVPINYNYKFQNVPICDEVKESNCSTASCVLETLTSNAALGKTE